jgi:hypothetical protein
VFFHRIQNTIYIFYDQYKYNLYLVRNFRKTVPLTIEFYSYIILHIYFISLQGNCSGDILLSYQNFHRINYKSSYEKINPVIRKCFVKLNRLDSVSLHRTKDHNSDFRNGHRNEYAGIRKQDLTGGLNTKQSVIKPYKCNQCDYSATHKAGLTAHINAVHYLIKPYKCNQCYYSTTLKSNLTQHINAVHTRIKPYKCNQCNYSATNTGHLTTHINAVHCLIKPYKCNRCDYSATQKGNLTKHINAVHSLLKPYKCKQCNFSATHPCHLRRHVNGVHSLG